MRIDAREDYASNGHTGSHHSTDDQPRIRIKVRGVADGEHRIDFLTDAAALDYPPFQDKVRIFASEAKGGDELQVQVGPSPVGHFDCPRCTGPFDKSVEV